MDDVKADWAQALAGYAQSPESISHALENLPADAPPTVGQFAILCRGAPRYQPLRIDAPQATPDRRAEIAAMLARTRRSVTGQAA